MIYMLTKSHLFSCLYVKCVFQWMVQANSKILKSNANAHWLWACGQKIIQKWEYDINNSLTVNHHSYPLRFNLAQLNSIHRHFLRFYPILPKKNKKHRQTWVGRMPRHFIRFIRAACGQTGVYLLAISSVVNEKKSPRTVFCHPFRKESCYHF